MVREKFQRKLYFSMKKIVILTLEKNAQVLFALDKYLTVFAIQHIGNRKKVLLKVGGCQKFYAANNIFPCFR